MSTDIGSPVDIQILKVLAESGLWLSASNIARNTGYVKGYIRPRCKRLVEEGLLDMDSGPGDPFYQITPEGREYLEDESET